MVEISDAGGFEKSVRFFIYLFHMPVFIFAAGLFFDKHNVTKCCSRVVFFIVLFVAMEIVTWLTDAMLFHTTSISLFYVNGMSWFLFAMPVWCAVLSLLRYVNPIVLIAFFTILALFTGYDDGIGAFLALSRIIVFFPFFILGTIIDKEKLMAAANKLIVKIIALVVLLLSFILILIVYDDIRWMESMLSGQNPFSAMGKFNEYGCIVRFCSYIMTFIVGTAFILVIPCGNLPITSLGQRSLGVYFWDSVLYDVQVFLAPVLHVWQFFVIAIIVTLLLSTKYVFAPFKKLLAVL